MSKFAGFTTGECRQLSHSFWGSQAANRRLGRILPHRDSQPQGRAHLEPELFPIFINCANLFGHQVGPELKDMFKRQLQTHLLRANESKEMEVGAQV